MILKEKNGVPFFQFPHLAEFSHIRHGIFTRKGGVSKANFASLNITFGLGDDDEAVKENRLRISRCMDNKELIFTSQVHGIAVSLIQDSKPTHQQSDAMITDMPDQLLAIQTADCQAVLLYEPQHHIAANVHSGWRGSIKNIVAHTIDKMQKNFDCEPRHLIAGIGPSLGPCCAEFIHYKKEIPERFWKYKDDKHHFDFWAITRDQLQETGVLNENIYTSEQCTKCNRNLFFSYRGEKQTGRFATVIGLV